MHLLHVMCRPPCYIDPRPPARRSKAHMWSGIAVQSWSDAQEPCLDTANDSPQTEPRGVVALSGWMPAVEGGWRKGRLVSDMRHLPLTPEVLAALHRGPDARTPRTSCPGRSA